MSKYVYRIGEVVTVILEDGTKKQTEVAWREYVPSPVGCSLDGVVYYRATDGLEFTDAQIDERYG